jgi:hypothetical protein
MTTDNRGFNTANLIRLARFGGAIWAWRPDASEDGVLELRSPSGRVAGFSGPPRRFTNETPTPETAGARVPRDLIFGNGDASAVIAQRALDDTWRHAETIAAAAADTRLAPQAKHDDLVAGTRTLLTAYAGYWRQLAANRDRIDALERNLFDPPAVADGAEAILDGEIRDRVGDMDDAELTNLLGQLRDDELAPVLLALRRDPLLAVAPDRDQELITAAWVARVEAEKPQAVEDYRGERETNEWALALLKWLASNVANWSLSGTAGALDRYAVFKLLQAGDALELADFEPADAQAFAARAVNDDARAKAEAAAAAARQRVPAAA